MITNQNFPWIPDPTDPTDRYEGLRKISEIVDALLDEGVISVTESEYMRGRRTMREEIVRYFDHLTDEISKRNMPTTENAIRLACRRMPQA